MRYIHDILIILNAFYGIAKYVNNILLAKKTMASYTLFKILRDIFWRHDNFSEYMISQARELQITAK